DAAGGIHPLLDLDGQREEVHALTGRGRGGGARQQHRVVVDVDGGRAARLLGEQTGLEPDDPLAVGAVVDDGFTGDEFGPLHGDLLSRGPQGRTVDRHALTVTVHT